MFDDEFEDQIISEDTSHQQLQIKDRFSFSPDLGLYPEEISKKATARYELVLFIRSRLTGGWTQKNIIPLLEEYFSQDRLITMPNWRTTVRWRKKLLEQCDTPASLVDMHHRKGNRNKKLHLDHDIIIESTNDLFLKAKRPSIAGAYRYYKEKCLLRDQSKGGGIRPMSQRAFYDRIYKQNSYEITVKRKSKYKADMKFGYKGGIIKPERVMQRVEIDHTPLDIILLDDETGKPIGRPNLTLLKDVYSGCLVGYHLTFKAPSYSSVAKAICHTLLPKSRSQELWGVEWPCNGKIEVLVVDNGAEFWSKSLEQMCLELGINIQYNPVRQPWLKPFIERNFRSINDLLLDEQDGKTFRSLDVRGEYDSVKEATIKFSDFVHAFEKWMAEVYNCSSDSRGLRVPSLLWQEGFDKLPPAKLNEQDTIDLPKIAGLKKTKTLQSSGITHELLRYDSEALSDYRKSCWSPDQRKKVIIKVDIDDVSKIYVYLSELNTYLTVPCVDKVYTYNLSLDQHLINKSLTRAKNLLHGKSDKDLAASRQEIREILAGHDANVKASTKVTTNKKAAQYKGYSSEKVRNAGKVSPTHEPKALDSSDDVSELEALWQSFNKD
jgi:putative transposase